MMFEWFIIRFGIEQKVSFFSKKKEKKKEEHVFNIKKATKNLSILTTSLR